MTNAISKLIGAAAILSAINGCALETAEVKHDESIATRSDSLRDGKIDTTTTSVVEIFVPKYNELCTGVVIKENIVLTARHCVADVKDNPETVDCNEATFAATYRAEDVFVWTTAQGGSVPVKRHSAKRIIVPDTYRVCGADLAVIVLADPIPETEAPSVELRLDVPVMKGETFTAVGFGRQGDFASAPAGVRIKKDAIPINCVGTDCTAKMVDEHDWFAIDGVGCNGDSGGPAFDTNGKVIGIISRSRPGCVANIYTDVPANADFVRRAVAETEFRSQGGCSTAKNQATSFVPIVIACIVVFLSRSQKNS